MCKEHSNSALSASFYRLPAKALQQKVKRYFCLAAWLLGCLAAWLLGLCSLLF